MEGWCEVVREKRALVTNSQFITAHEKKNRLSVLSRFRIFIHTTFSKYNSIVLHFAVAMCYNTILYMSLLPTTVAHFLT